MSIDQEFLDLLVCPLCKATLKLTGDNKGLKCVECRRVYPIVGEIPDMLVDDARIEPE